jgi:hypothetical protein
MTTPLTEQASAIADPQAQTALGTPTGAEVVTVKTAAGVLQTTLSAIAQWIIQTYQGFTQLGAGAIPRTAQSKLQETVSVLDFGGGADGDVSAAFQAAINALPSAGGKIKVPDGAYTVNTAPTWGTKSIFWDFGPNVAITGTQTSFPAMVTNNGVLPVGPWIVSQSTKAATATNGTSAFSVEVDQPESLNGGVGAYYGGINLTSDGANSIGLAANLVATAQAGSSGNIWGLEIDVGMYAPTNTGTQFGLSLNGDGTGNPTFGIKMQRADSSLWQMCIDIRIAITGLLIEDTAGMTNGIVVGHIPTMYPNNTMMVGQLANDGESIVLQRFTDVEPTGYLINAVNAGNTGQLFSVDVLGNVIAAGTINGEYLASGTGAVARQLSAKLGDVVSVADFAVSGNDTASLQAAINACLTSGAELVIASNYTISGTVTVGAGSLKIRGTGGWLNFTGTGTVNFTNNDTDVDITDLYINAEGSVTALNFVGTGGLFLNWKGGKIFSTSESTSSNIVSIVGVYGSISKVECNAGTGNQDVFYIYAPTANLEFLSPHSYGNQSRSFCNMYGGGTAFGVQGIRFTSPLLLNNHNGLIASDNIDSVEVTGGMVDSMQVPISFTGVLNGTLTGTYFGGMSATVSPINLTDCTNFSMVGGAVQAYTGNPPPVCVYFDGGSNHTFTGVAFTLSGSTSPYTPNTSPFAGTEPTYLSVIGCPGAKTSLIANSPPQFDNSTNIATTASVTAMGRVFASQTILETSTTLTAADCGSLILADSATAITLTVPLSTSIPSFLGSLFIFNYGAGTLTLAAQGTDTIRTATFTLATNAFIELINNPGGNSWLVVNRGAS